jgi:hypothetical protein
MSIHVAPGASDGGHLRGSRQDCDHDIDIRRDLGHRPSPVSPRHHGVALSLGHHVCCGHGEASLNESRAHRQPHLTQSDDPDVMTPSVRHPEIMTGPPPSVPARCLQQSQSNW